MRKRYVVISRQARERNHKRAGRHQPVHAQAFTKLLQQASGGYGAQPAFCGADNAVNVVMSG